MDLNEFNVATVTCRTCGWSGKGEQMTSGESHGSGVDKHCPVPTCDARWGFVAYPVFVTDAAPADWKAKLGDVAD